MKRIFASLFAILMLGCATAQAQNCGTYPNILTNGTTADANQVMADFNLIRNCANNSLAHNAANSDITSITGLTTPLAPSQGGTPLFIGGTSTGAANAQVVASTTPNSFGLTQGFAVSFVAGFSNSGATTLNVNSTGVKTVQKMASGALAALVTGDIVTGTQYYVTWDGTVFELLNPSNYVVATVGVSQGGTGATTLTAHGVLLGEGTSAITPTAVGTNGQILIGNSAADPTWFTPFTLTSITTTSTYTPATGEFRDWVRCVGAGGGGAGTNVGTADGGGGGAGAYSEGVVSVTPAVGITVTIGTGGAGGTNAPTSGGTGGDTSFGASVVAKGGSGGAPTGSNGGRGGLASGGTGTVKFDGGPGNDGGVSNGVLQIPGGTGGVSNFGGGASAQGTPTNATVPGSGGGGAYGGSGPGSNGANGACIIMALP